MPRVDSSIKYSHKMSQLTNLPQYMCKELQEMFKLIACHDVLDKIKDNKKITINLADLGLLTIRCNNKTDKLEYTFKIDSKLDRMFNDVFDTQESPLVTKAYDKLIESVTDKMELLL